MGWEFRKLSNLDFFEVQSLIKNLKSQSAMEYLMTYGWAILIIAVVLVALFQIGIFNSANFAPKAQPGACFVSKTAFVQPSLEGLCNNELPQYVAQFNGASSYVSFPYISLKNMQFTVSAWVYVNHFDGSGQVSILGCNTAPCGGGDNEIHIGFRNNEAFFGLYGDDISSTTPYGTDTWYLVTYAMDSSHVKHIYVDGQAVPTSGGNTNYYQAGVHLIGNSCCLDYMNGVISNVQIYNTSLSANGVDALYNEGIGGAPIDLPNLVGWWPLNGNANDYSGNNNNGAANSVIYTGSWTSYYPLQHSTQATSSSSTTITSTSTTTSTTSSTITTTSSTSTSTYTST